jgi:choice-of-anchor C domain-containing protein
VIAIATSNAASADLIVNGGFELPGGFATYGAGSTAIPGWTVTRDNIDYIGGCGEGSRCLDLDGTVGFGGIAQTFETVSGQQYLVSFLLSGNPARYSPSEPLEKYLGVSAASASASFVFTVTPPLEGSPTNWTLEQWSFIANDSSTTIEFYSLDSLELGHSGFFGPALDAVSVQPIPEPSAGLLVGFGLFLLALRNR